MYYFTPIACYCYSELLELTCCGGLTLDVLFQSFQAIRRLPPEYSGIEKLIYRWPDEDFTLKKITDELVPE